MSSPLYYSFRLICSLYFGHPRPSTETGDHLFTPEGRIQNHPFLLEFWTTASSVQILLLTLHSAITPSGAHMRCWRWNPGQTYAKQVPCPQYYHADLSLRCEVGGPYGLPKMEPRLATCKTNTFSTVLWLLPFPFEVSVNLAFGKQSVGPKAGYVWDIDPPLTSTVHAHSSHTHLLCLPRAPVLWEQPRAGSGLIFSHL